MVCSLERHPLIKIFQSSSYATVYDARSNFAVNIELAQLDMLFAALGYPTKVRLTGNRSKESLELRQLMDLGLFAPGPLPETYSTDRQALQGIVRHYATHTITRKFSLEVTQSCNFRCTYCPYSVPSSNRAHSSLHMSLEIACKAIDRYFERYVALVSSLSEDAKRDVLDSAPPNLGWYGGEPLLNFPIIKASQAYFSGLPWASYGIEPDNIVYTLNTNFSVASDEIFEFLVRHKVLSYISIDGPQAENDRNRVDDSGNGTFERVHANLMRLKEYDRQYFDTRVILLSTICPDHDRDLCREYLQELGASNFQSDAQMPGQLVSDYGKMPGLPDENTLNALKSAMSQGMEDLEDFYRKSPPFRNIFKNLNKQFFAIRTSVPQKEQVPLPLGMRTCPMGFDQLLVSANGEFHMCQKTDNSLPLGSCEKGHDLEAVVEGYRLFHTALNSDRCRACWAIRFCDVCSAPLLSGGTFRTPTDRECDYIRHSLAASFSYFQVISEDEDFFFRLAERARSGVVDISAFRGEKTPEEHCR